MRHTGLFVNLWRPCPNYALPERPVQPNGVSVRTERVADTIGLCRDRTADGEARQVGPSRKASVAVQKEASFCSVHVALKRKKRLIYLGFLHFRRSR